mmetsp:Transcript_51032/g.123064  ORF Transcript_51032/g.123064 Transcript_51032/m.123064 type:complete len:621 (-) Transcript_51032:6028-7890(-)
MCGCRRASRVSIPGASFLLLLMVAAVLRPHKVDAKNNLWTYDANLTAGVTCHCSGKHPANEMYECRSTRDGGQLFFEEYTCPDANARAKCDQPPEVEAPYLDFLPICKHGGDGDREELNARVCDDVMDRTVNLDELQCRCGDPDRSVHEIECYRNFTDGSSCLAARRYCDFDWEICTSGERFFPYGEWYRACSKSSSDEDKYPVCDDEDGGTMDFQAGADAVIDNANTTVLCECRQVDETYNCYKVNIKGGENDTSDASDIDVDKMCLVKRESCPSEYQCAGKVGEYFPYGDIGGNSDENGNDNGGPGTMCVSGYLAEANELQSAGAILFGRDTWYYCVRPGHISCVVTHVDPSLDGERLGLGMYSFAFSEHYGEFFGRMVQHGLVNGTKFDANVHPDSYGIYLSIQDDQQRIYSDSYFNFDKGVNDFLQLLEVDYDVDLSSNFRFYQQTSSGEPIFQMTCDGFRPLTMFEGQQADFEYDSCVRDARLALDFRDSVWPPRTWRTEEQLRKYAKLGFGSGVLSVLGSTFILTSLFVRFYRYRHSATRDRLLLGMSFLDLISSISILLGPLPSPSDGPGAVNALWNLGSQETCSVSDQRRDQKSDKNMLLSYTSCIFFDLFL